MRKLSRIVPLLILLGGCRAASGPATEAAAPRKVELAAGTPIRLVLFDELTSGGSAEGTEVRLALMESVQGLPAMSPATAVVSWSRTEGTLGGLTGRPARLRLTLKSLKGPNGEDIPLSAEAQGQSDYELNRANTGRPSSVAQKEPEEEDVAVGNAVKELIEQGQSGGLNSEQVGQLARKLGMNETAKLADAGKLDQVQSLCRKIRDGGAIADLASGGTIAAAMELVHLAGDVGHRLGKSLGGRNIRAYPGTVIPAYVAETTTVTVGS
ncbi:hypothetical protein EON79_14730 [bacterium]|nr:MAG: hypothetical protein EON79_14730 [bacterium]